MPVFSYVTLDEILKLSVPQCSHLQDEDDITCFYHREQCEDVKH